MALVLRQPAFADHATRALASALAIRRPAGWRPKQTGGGSKTKSVCLNEPGADFPALSRNKNH